jgi:predicted flap endonuclease-1-like 5' DNA nuclease
MANGKIEEIEGIGPALGAKFEAAGVADTDALLAQGATSAGRKALATATGLSESRILTFVNMADLFRIDGVAGEYAELLVAAGVDTVKELATRNGENLAKKLAEVNAAKHLTRRVPSQTTVEDWIRQAGALPAKISH